MTAEALILLEEAVDQVGMLELDDVTADELHELVRGLGAVASRLEAQTVRVIERWDATMAWADNGSKAPGARLARETSQPRANTDQLVRRGRALRTMPHTRAAYLAGEIIGAHVDMIGRCDRQWANADFADEEEKLVNLCRTNVFGAAAEAVRYWQMFADRDVDNPDPDKAAKDCDKNTLSASFSFEGRLFIDGNLDAIGGEIFKGELDRLSEEFRLSDAREGVERTPAQRRAAGLVEMATRSATAPADGQRPKPLITVTMGIGHFSWMCQTGAGTIIEPELMLPYLSQAEIERMIFDPPNRKLEASSKTMFTGVMRKIIGLRDRRCQHPSGCDEPAHRCDVDHIAPRSCGGITCLCNGQLLCRYHNRFVKAEHDRRLALRHKAEREAERHQTGCLLAHPEPCRFVIDTDDDEGIPPELRAKLFDRLGNRVRIYRIRPAA